MEDAASKEEGGGGHRCPAVGFNKCNGNLAVAANWPRNEMGVILFAAGGADDDSDFFNMFAAEDITHLPMGGRQWRGLVPSCWKST
jgi:hypothetical protein